MSFVAYDMANFTSCKLFEKFAIISKYRFNFWNFLKLQNLKNFHFRCLKKSNNVNRSKKNRTVLNSSKTLLDIILLGADLEIFIYCIKDFYLFIV